MLINIIGNQMVTALNNTGTSKEQIQKKNYEKEIEITSSIQRSILPKMKMMKGIKLGRFQNLPR